MSSRPPWASGRLHAIRVMVSVVLSVTALLLVAGCSGGDRNQPTSEPSAAPGITGAPPAARALGQQQNASLSALAVVKALARSGFLVPNPLDVTTQICRSNGCDQSIVTDTLRVTSFPSPEAAKLYAHQHGLRHSENVVVAFPPVMATTEQDKYWSAIVKMFP